MGEGKIWKKQNYTKNGVVTTLKKKKKEKEMSFPPRK